MRYIIVHLIRGEAKQAHEAITKDLTEKFGAMPLHERIAPHLTLKRWTELDEQAMQKLCNCLDTFANSHKQSNFSLNGFGHFEKDVIYMDVTPSAEMEKTALDLMDKLHGLKDLKFDEFDNGGNFHATVAMKALPPFDYEQIWNYLQTTTAPKFDMKFDNIALLKKPVDKWVIERVWELGL